MNSVRAGRVPPHTPASSSCLIQQELKKCRLSLPPSLFPGRSGSGLNTSNGQQRAGDDQLSSPAEPLFRPQAPREEQVSPGGRTSEGSVWARKQPARLRQKSVFSRWICGSRLALDQRVLRQPVRMYWRPQRRCPEKGQEDWIATAEATPSEP